MAFLETVQRIRERLLLEVLDLDPIEEPLPPKAEWPQWDRNSSSDVSLRVLSLNAWGLPVAPKCTERALEIANAIQGPYELVVLQEIWHKRERNLIISRAKEAGYHYYHYFNAAVGFPVPLGPDSFGTGLLALSKFPIVDVMYHSFSLSGRPYALHEADFVANKGVGLLRVETPAGQVDMYLTHLIANYNHLGAPGPGDRYLPHRTGQSYELAQFIAATTRNDLVLVCGDFNSPSDDLVLRIPRVTLQLRDAYKDRNASEGLTFATVDNKYSHGEHPMRMDYILYKVAPLENAPEEPRWHLVKSDVFKGFFTDANGDKTPLSDHFGVKAEFVFGSPRENGSSEYEQASEELDVDDTKVKTLQDVRDIIISGRLDASERRLGHLRRSAISIASVLLIMFVHLVLVQTTWGPFVSFLLVMWGLLEYLLAFFFVTLECSTFTELANQVRIHLHAEHAGKSKSTWSLRDNPSLE